ncbi:MAG: hypothetical protein WC528_04325 [Patescibacteria group bacterium]
MAKLTDTETGVKLAVPVTQKISIGIMMVGAFAALFGIALGMSYQLPKEKATPAIGALAFKPLSLSDGKPSTLESQYIRNFNFRPGFNESALTENEYLEGSWSELIAVGAVPAEFSDIHLSDIERIRIQTPADDPSRYYPNLPDEYLEWINTNQTIPWDAQDVNFSPHSWHLFYANTTGAGVAGDYIVLISQITDETRGLHDVVWNVRFFFDRTTKKLAYVGYVWADPDVATPPNLNLNFYLWEDSSNIIGFQFLRDNVVMATYNQAGFTGLLNDNTNINSGVLSGTTYSIEDPQPVISPGSKSPLQVKISQSVKEKAVTPPMTFSLVTDIGAKTLCFPSNVLTQNSVVSYYYDVDGTPYTDVRLTKMATPRTCKKMLAAGLKPTDIISGVPNKEWDFNIRASLDFKRENTWLAHYNLQDQTFWDDSSVENSNTQTPLFIEAVHAGFGGNITINSQTFILNSNLGTNTICIPRTDIIEYSPVRYYYDINGTPYSDILLTKPILDKGCGELLVNSYNPSDITSMSLSKDWEVNARAATIEFVRNRTTLGRYLIEEHRYTSDMTAQLPDSKSPLYIRLMHGGFIGNINIDARFATLQTNLGSLKICIPDSTIIEYNPTIYYYDNTGKPYSDPFLKNSVVCLLCEDGTRADGCNASQQYCNSDTLTLKKICEKCGYTCEPGTGSKSIPIED